MENLIVELIAREEKTDKNGRKFRGVKLSDGRWYNSYVEQTKGQPVQGTIKGTFINSGQPSKRIPLVDTSDFRNEVVDRLQRIQEGLDILLDKKAGDSLRGTDYGSGEY